MTRVKGPYIGSKGPGSLCIFCKADQGVCFLLTESLDCRIYVCLASQKSNIGEQCRPRLDIAECVSDHGLQFALNIDLFFCKETVQLNTCTAELGYALPLQTV